MPQTIEFDGQQHEFPDDFTDADISKALGTGTPKAAAPPSVQRPALPWGLSSVSENPSADPGSIDRLQSSPSLGAMGGMINRPMDSGAIKEVAKAEGKGALLSTAVVAPGVAAGAGVATQIGVGALSGIIQSKILGGSNKEAAVSGLTGGVLGGVSGVIPRASTAIAALRRLSGVAPESTVPLKNAVGPTIDILKEAKSGGQQPKVITDLMKRVNQGGPLTYEEARRFYSNASRISADESGKLTDTMKYLLGNFREAMHQDIVANRAAYGLGANYDQTIKQIAAAKSFQRAAVTTAKVGGAAAGTAALGNVGWKILQAMSAGRSR